MCEAHLSLREMKNGHVLAARHCGDATNIVIVDYGGAVTAAKANRVTHGPKYKFYCNTNVLFGRKRGGCNDGVKIYKKKNGI